MSGLLARVTPLTSLLSMAAVSLVLGPNYFSAASGAGLALQAASWIGLCGAMLPWASRPMASLACDAVVGLSTALLWAVSPVGWLHALLAIAFRLVLAPSGRRERLILSSAAIVPCTLIAIAFLPGLGDSRRVLLDPIVRALPKTPVALSHVAAIGCALGLIRGTFPSGTEVRHRAARAAGTACVLVGLGAALWARGRFTLAKVHLPVDGYQWSEPPLLMNVLKWQEGVPLFGDPFELRSLTYSPTLELLHAAVLSPFGKALDIVAHRYLVLGWQVAAAALLALSFRREPATDSERQGAVPLLTIFVVAILVAWWSPASPFLHADHAIQFIAAIALGILMNASFPARRRQLVSLGLASLAAALFKLTGIGVAAGLAAVAVLERRREFIAPLAIAGVLIGLSLPLYDALFGRFTYYAIGVMSHHTVNWVRLLELPLFPEGRVLLGTVLFVAATRNDKALRVTTFMLGLAGVTGLAFLKEGGRVNSLIAPALAALVASLASLRREGLLRRADVPLLATLFALAPGTLPENDRSRFEAYLHDHDVAREFVRAEVSAGRNPLVHLGTTLHLEAIGRTVPEDQLPAAIELFMAGHPGFEAHLAHLESGKYGSIVTPWATFVARTMASTLLGERLHAAVEDRYCVVYPTSKEGRVVPLRAGDGLLILRRRDLGCDPLFASHKN